MAIFTSVLNFSLTFLAACAYANANIGIPVLLWGDKISLSGIAKPLAGHTVSANDFGYQLSRLKVPQLAVVFEQDELSSEDFLQFAKRADHDGAFTNLQELMTKEYNVYMPSVKAPSHGLESWNTQFKNVIDVSNMDDLSSLKLTAGTLIIVHLQKTANVGNIKTVLTANDNLIGNVIQHVQQSSLSYVASFTGRAHRKVHEAVYQNTGRHLMAKSDDNNTVCVHVSKCLIFYADGVSFNGKEWTNETFSISELNNCTGSNFSFVMKSGSDKFNVHVDKFNGMWKAKSITYEDSPLMFTKNSSSDDIAAPLGMSFSCGARIILNDFNTNTTTKTNTLEFKNLQMQAFLFKKDNEFGNPYDCIGFFTIPIWTGVLTGLFFVFITLAGMSMLANINTFDQMDDPKGPVLNINISE